jgi:hypothetical protein
MSNGPLRTRGTRETHDTHGLRAGDAFHGISGRLRSVLEDGIMPGHEDRDASRLTTKAQ